MEYFQEVYYINGEKDKDDGESSYYNLVVKVVNLDTYNITSLEEIIDTIEKKYNLIIYVFSTNKEYLHITINEKTYLKLQRIKKLKKVFYE